MQLESTAFVLRTYPLRESDRIVVLYSRAEGKLRGVAPREAASRKRFGGALSILNEVEFSYHEKEGRDLGRLDWCRLLHATPGEGRDLDAFYASSYMAEVLEQMGGERERDERLYRLVQACARALDEGMHAPWVARYFEVWTLRLGGLLPELASCATCSGELTRTGTLLVPGEEAVCPACGRGREGARLSAGAVALVRSMLRNPPAGSSAAQPPSDHLAAVARMAAAQFLHVVERPFRTVSMVTGKGNKMAVVAPGRKS
jgi:DNA repair protein RecO (recombination protein O)